MIYFVIYYILVSFKKSGAKLPEDGVNDAERRSNNKRLYFKCQIRNRRCRERTV